MTKLLVTGCAGFVGSHTVSDLVKHGHQVVGVDSFATELYPAAQKLDRVRQLQSDGGFEFRRLDLRHDSIAPHLDGVEVVLHFAALAGLLTSAEDRAAYAGHNVDATRNVLDAISGSGIHLVHASTSSVYGSVAFGDESAPLAPTSAYGSSKVKAEKLIEGYQNDGRVTATILRLFSAYGPAQRPDMAYAKACRALLTGQTMTIFGDGSQTRSNTYVADVARAARLSAERRPPTTMNIAGNQSIRLLDAIHILASILGVEPRLTFEAARPGDQLSTNGSTARAGDVLGWSPLTAIGDGLASQASWFRNLYEREAALSG